jgi:hypothetical protein
MSRFNDKIFRQLLRFLYSNDSGEAGVSVLLGCGGASLSIGARRFETA